jgi:hypothetical protein
VESLDEYVAEFVVADPSLCVGFCWMQTCVRVIGEDNKAVTGIELGSQLVEFGICIVQVL